MPSRLPAHRLLPSVAQHAATLVHVPTLLRAIVCQSPFPSAPLETRQRNAAAAQPRRRHPMLGPAAIPEVGLRAQALLQAALATGQARSDVLVGGVALLLVWLTARAVASIARFVHMYYLRPAIDPRTFGSWAVVTGASEGIGRALSNLLAEKGERSPSACALFQLPKWNC